MASWAGRMADYVPRRGHPGGPSRAHRTSLPANGPDEAGWLQPEERDWLRGALEQENRIKSNHGEYTTRQALTNGKVWLLAAIYFGVVTNLYGVSFWLPLIIEDISGFGTFVVGLLGAIPYLAGAVGMVL
jgi:sugar phosphate permease